MARMTIPGSKREDIIQLPPEALTLIDDKSHALYDERASIPLDPALVESMYHKGNLIPLLVRKNGDGKIEIVDGRQRYRASIEVNKRLKKEKQDPILLRCRFVKGDDMEVMDDMTVANAVRQQDPPSLQATKMQRSIEFGKSEDDVALAWGCTRQTVRNRLKILDCTPKVRKALDQGLIKETHVRDLAKLDRKEQNAALDEILKQGLKGGAMKDALGKKTGKNGKKVGGDGPKLRPKKFITGFSEALIESDKPTKDQTLAHAVISYLMGDDDALDDVPSVKKVAESLKADGTPREDEEEEEEDGEE
jgi:ParB family chromosome partitioning protein